MTKFLLATVHVQEVEGRSIPSKANNILECLFSHHVPLSFSLILSLFIPLLPFHPPLLSLFLSLYPLSPLPHCVPCPLSQILSLSPFYLFSLFTSLLLSSSFTPPLLLSSLSPAPLLILLPHPSHPPLLPLGALSESYLLNIC